LRPKKKSEVVGVGCLVQGIGLVAPFFLYELMGYDGVVIGLLLMVVLLLIGSRMALKWICPACGNPVAFKNVKVCPSCRAEFE